MDELCLVGVAESLRFLASSDIVRALGDMSMPVTSNKPRKGQQVIEEVSN